MPILTPPPSAKFEIGAYVSAIADTTPGMHPKYSEDVQRQVTQVDIEGGRTRIESNWNSAYTAFGNIHILFINQPTLFTNISLSCVKSYDS
jgi:hypothetical protein